MILLMNVFITNKGLNKYDRGGLPSYDRLDIFKYTLASYAAIPWFSKAIFNIKLDAEYKDKQNDLYNYIMHLFGYRTDVSWTRCEHQREWLELIDKTATTEPIWLACNDDHPFIDYDLDCLEACLYAYDKEPDPFKAIYYSHWVEPYRHAKDYFTRGWFDKFNILPNGVLQTDWDRKDSIQIVSHALLTSWWTDRNYGNQYKPRTDFFENINEWYTKRYTCFIPPRELCRHFDGASHLFNPKDVPPLTIPKGWDTGEIRLLKSDLDFTYYVPYFWGPNNLFADIMKQTKSKDGYYRQRRRMALASTVHPDFQELPDEQWLLQGDPKW